MKKLFVFIVLMQIPAMFAQTRIMSYNIRVDFGGDHHNNWEFRRDFLVGQILWNNPDFIGLQEARRHQLKFIDSLLPNHSAIGRGRDDSPSQGEFSSILYNSSKFRLVRDQTFWLSPTPEKVSKGWDAAYERICTFGEFEEIKSGQRFLVFNTHFDHVGQRAREESIQLILRKMSSENPKYLPAVLLGDFNVEASNIVYLKATQQLNDAKSVAKIKAFGPAGTFNNFKFDEPVKQRIDYIFVSKEIEVSQFATLSDSEDCRYPSDHLPILADIILKP